MGNSRLQAARIGATYPGWFNNWFAQFGIVLPDSQGWCNRCIHLRALWEMFPSHDPLQSLDRGEGSGEISFEKALVEIGWWVNPPHVSKRAFQDQKAWWRLGGGFFLVTLGFESLVGIEDSLPGTGGRVSISSIVGAEDKDIERGRQKRKKEKRKKKEEVEDLYHLSI